MGMKNCVITVKKITMFLLFTLVLALFLPAPINVKAASTDIVYIPDAVLKASLNTALGVSDGTADITQKQLQSIEVLNAGSTTTKVNSLTGLEYCTALVNITVYTDNEDLDYSMLSTLPNLKYLSIYGAGINNLNHISACRNIISLRLGVDYLEALPVVPSVTDLFIYGSDIDTVTDLSALADMPNIEELSMYHVESNDYSAISALSKLESLFLMDCDIVSMPDLSNTPFLEYVCIFVCKELTDISGISGLTVIENLSFSGCKSLKDLSPLANLKSLNTLNLSQVNICGDGQYATANADAIATLSNLTELILANAKLSNEYIYMFHTLSNLKKLDIDETGITDLSFLSHLTKNLQYLSVIGNHIGNDCVPYLAQMKNMIGLCVFNTYITDFSFISQMSSLKLTTAEHSHNWSNTTTLSNVNYNVISLSSTSSRPVVFTIENDVKDHKGNIVVPVESDKFVYDAATNTIKVTLPADTNKVGVTVKYEINMVAPTGDTLRVSHNKSIVVERLKRVSMVEQPEDVIVVEGSDTRMSAYASGSGFLYYQWYKDGVLLEGETGSSILFTNTQLSQAGSYTVKVTDSKTNLSVTSNVAVLTVQPKPITVSAKVNQSNVKSGDKVTITVTADGGTRQYTYKYLIYNAETKEWANLSGGYIANSSFTWIAGGAGARRFYVDVKDSAGTVVRSNVMNVNVTSEPLKISVKSDATSVEPGEKVAFTASAMGGDTNYTYSYLVYNRTTKEWARLTSFGANSTYTWTAGSVGNRSFYVEVKDGTGAVVRSEAINIEVTSQELAITAKSSVSTAVKGDKVTISATATGGAGDYTYSYLVYNVATKEWHRFNSFTASNTYTWTAGSAGTRRFYVEVKDGAGTVVRSSAVTVTVQ